MTRQEQINWTVQAIRLEVILTEKGEFSLQSLNHIISCQRRAKHRSWAIYLNMVISHILQISIDDFLILNISEVDSRPKGLDIRQNALQVIYWSLIFVITFLLIRIRLIKFDELPVSID